MEKSKNYLILLISYLFCTMLVGLVAPGNNFTIHGKAYAAEELKDRQKMEIADVFDDLAVDKYIYTKNLMKQAVKDAFENRQESAIDYAITVLDESMNFREGEELVANYRFRVAKSVLLSFHNKALSGLLKKYKTADAITKGNLIHVIGKLDSNDNRIRRLLLDALEDVSPCEEEDLELDIKSLRVCDAAYNELVLRYSIPNVPRTIGTIHSIEVRDEQINKLKKLI